MRSGALVLVVLLSGCANIEAIRWRDTPEGPMSWRAGFVDGCMSGRQDARGVNQPDIDKARYRADDQYRAGWDEGRKECFGREEIALNAPPTPTPTESPPRAETPVLATPLPPAAAAPPVSKVARRAQVESRIAELKRELGALEAELDTLE